MQISCLKSIFWPFFVFCSKICFTISMSQELAKGHRTRLRQRFMKAPESLPDYEILELLLFAALPRKDVKPIAKNLIKHFKTLKGIVCSDKYMLEQIGGLGEQASLFMNVLKELTSRILKDDLRMQSLLNSQDRVTEYLKVNMAYLIHEQFRVLFLNTKYFLILDEVQQQGTTDQVALYARNIVKRALEIGASAIILVHNHPTGDSTPSRADIESTMLLQQACLNMNIKLIDHVIIGKYGFYSFLEQGLLTSEDV